RLVARAEDCLLPAPTAFVLGAQKLGRETLSPLDIELAALAESNAQILGEVGKKTAARVGRRVGWNYKPERSLSACHCRLIDCRRGGAAEGPPVVSVRTR